MHFQTLGDLLPGLSINPSTGNAFVNWGFTSSVYYNANTHEIDFLSLENSNLTTEKTIPYQFL